MIEITFGVIDGAMLGRPLTSAHPGKWVGWSSNKAHPNYPRFQVEVWLSHVALVQVFDQPGWWQRLSIKWKMPHRGPTWEDLQEIGHDIVGADRTLVEVFPPTADVVNVATMRHLWVVPPNVDLPFVWRRGPRHYDIFK